MPIDRPLRFFFIDDDRHVTADFKRGLPADRQFEVGQINCSPFLDSIKATKIADFGADLIVLDLLLRDDTSSGERLLRQLKESEEIKQLRGIDVVLLSSFPDEEKKTAEKFGDFLRGFVSKNDPEWSEKLWQYASQSAEAKR